MLISPINGSSNPDPACGQMTPEQLYLKATERLGYNANELVLFVPRNNGRDGRFYAVVDAFDAQPPVFLKGVPFGTKDHAAAWSEPRNALWAGMHGLGPQVRSAICLRPPQVGILALDLVDGQPLDKPDLANPNTRLQVLKALKVYHDTAAQHPPYARTVASIDRRAVAESELAALQASSQTSFLSIEVLRTLSINVERAMHQRRIDWVFSPGDMHPGNIMDTAKGIQFIDAEDAQYRDRYYDMARLFFAFRRPNQEANQALTAYQGATSGTSADAFHLQAWVTMMDIQWYACHMRNLSDVGQPVVDVMIERVRSDCANLSLLVEKSYVSADIAAAIHETCNMFV